MKIGRRETAWAAAALALIVLPASGQVPASGSPPAPSSTRTRRDSAATAGAATPTPAVPRTPRSRSDRYAIHRGTPVGMPIYPTPGIAETTAAGRPAAVSDCAGDMWHRFRAPEFRSRKICEDWVRKHPAGRKIARSRTPARRPTAPR